MNDGKPTYDAATYTSSQVRLYGLLVKPDDDGKINLGGIQVAATGGAQLACCRTSDPDADLHAAIIFGYAYQGHCYELPKPQVMLLPHEGDEVNKEGCDCGYSGKHDYRVWQVDQQQVAVAVETTEGRIEELVLASNMPGTGAGTTYRGALQTYRGAMQTYRGAMQVAHRSGRLTE